MKKDFRVWIFKARENGEIVMVGSSEREGLMSVYTLDRKHGIVARSEKTWAEIDSWQMIYVTTIKRWHRPSVELFGLFK